MPAPLQLTLTEYIDGTRWRWVLSDHRGSFLADHPVQLDVISREYGGWLDLRRYLDFNKPIATYQEQLDTLGRWIGAQVFGGLRATLWKQRSSPALAVHVSVPETASDLLQRPFELARFADGRSFREAGIRFVYQIETGEPSAQPGDKQPITSALRILAVFSLPVSSNPLNLRRERYELQRLVRELNRTQGVAIELRVLQYGATRETLETALQDGAGWDVVHLSGHGTSGELLLEDERGNTATIAADELGDLLAMTRERLKLLILDSCYSGAGSHAAARAQVGLDQEATRTDGATAAQETPLPGLAQALSERLDCAALAMRYPVGDGFATELMLALYEKLLLRGQPLPAAVQLALKDALAADIPKPPLSPATPMLVGPRAAALHLKPPAQSPQFELPTVGLGIAFPAEPARFVGRMQPMLRASQALAPRSAQRGVLFYGMPGAGKTSCALELAYRHEHGRFVGYVWYQAPEEGSDISSALLNLMQDIQTQLGAPTLGLTTALSDPAEFRRSTLPRLRALLQQYALLLVLDNLETLLTASGNWRDPLWGDVLGALLAHNGLSRVVLTSRRVPADLERNPQVLRESIHALSLAESVLLARELPNLKRLFNNDDEQQDTPETKERLALLQRTLLVVQGHPKLLELADGLAADQTVLAERVRAAAQEQADEIDLLNSFFAAGTLREGETLQSDAKFVQALQGWTAGVAATLTPSAALLFAFLCRLEPEDRQRYVVDDNWKDLLTRLGEVHAVAAAALTEPEQGLPLALAVLEAAGLIAVDRPANEPTQRAALLTTYSIHPGVAESARNATEQAVLDATDIELGNYHIAMYRHGLKTEMQGGGGIVTGSARRAAPYLLRQSRWKEGSTLLENMLHRDSSPASLAFALLLLRRIVEATAGTKEGLENAGILANTLWQAGHIAEAEQMLRNLIAQSIFQQNYRNASVAAGVLLNLLRSGGRLAEALAVAEEMAGYTRQAGLGPWTQLGDEAMRLQVLAAMGRYDEVLATVEALRPQLATLPEQSEAEESIDQWNVRETLLDTGHTAALYSERWEMALALNAEIVQVRQARGADALELARTRFNDYGPLLRLRRYDDARSTLLACRAVFEAERQIEALGKVYTALADLEDKTGAQAAAVRFEQVALGYTYQEGQPEDCAMSHGNIANYLERQDGNSDNVVAHRLATALIFLQTQSGQLRTALKNLAISDLPSSPPTFAAVTERVEAIPGVRFHDLFERLPRTAPDGDAAIAAVWQLVREEKRRREEDKQRREEERQRQAAVLASLPATIQTAFELEGQEFSAALRAALGELPAEEATVIMQQLREGDLISSPAGPDMTQVLNQFEPLLQRIATAAADASLRDEIELELAKIEENGWMLRDAAHHIWAGRRDAATLTASLDAQDSALVRRVLQLLEAEMSDEG